MPSNSHNDLHSVNLELRNFLAQVDALLRGTGDIDAGQLRVVRRLLEATGPQIGEASQSAAADAVLRAELEAYTENLRALQASIDQIRCVMLARREQLEAAQQHMHGLRDWVNAYRRTAP